MQWLDFNTYIIFFLDPIGQQDTGREYFDIDAEYLANDFESRVSE